MKLMKLGLTAAVTCGLAAFASADVIMDQIGDGSSQYSIGASQDFAEPYDAYDVIAVEDFTIGEAMDLSSASMMLGGWNGFAGSAGVIGYTVSIFSSLDAAGTSIFGDIASIYLVNGVDPGVTYDTDWAGQGEYVTLDMSGVSLAAGTYYIGIAAHNDFGANGQTGVYFGDDLGDGSGAQANPSGAFGFGPYQMTGVNYAYRLDGNAVPAPGVLALLGLAGLASRRRRS